LHGIPIGEDAPELVNTYIETVPSDTVKYEIDKKKRFLKVDVLKNIPVYVQPFTVSYPRPIVIRIS